MDTSVAPAWVVTAELAQLLTEHSIPVGLDGLVALDGAVLAAIRQASRWELPSTRCRRAVPVVQVPLEERMSGSRPSGSMNRKVKHGKRSPSGTQAPEPAPAN